MDISSNVISVIQALFSPIPLIWNWCDQLYVLPSVSLLDLLVSVFVLSSVLWLVFGFNEKGEE